MHAEKRRSDQRKIPAQRLRPQTSPGLHLLSNKSAKSACAACVNLRSLHLFERLRLLFHIPGAGWGNAILAFVQSLVHLVSR